MEILRNLKLDSSCGILNSNTVEISTRFSLAYVVVFLKDYNRYYSVIKFRNRVNRRYRRFFL